MDEDIRKLCQHGHWGQVISMLLQAQVGLVVASKVVSVAVQVDFEEASEIAISVVVQASDFKASAMDLAAKLLLTLHLGQVVDEAVALVPQTETVKLAAGMIVNRRDQQEAI